jgi:hypothetical protein
VVASSLSDGIQEDVVVITASFPEGKPTQPVRLDEFALGSERVRIIKRNHDLRGRIINVRLWDRKISIVPD